MAALLDSLREAGAQEQVTALLPRDPAAHVPLDDPGAVARLLDSLREAGAQEQVTALLHRDPAAHVPLGDPHAVAELLDSPAGGGRAGAGHRAGRAAPPPTSPSATRTPWPACWTACEAAGAQEQVTALASRAAAHVPLDDPDAVADCWTACEEAGAQEQATALADRAAAHVPLDDPDAVATC